MTKTYEIPANSLATSAALYLLEDPIGTDDDSILKIKYDSIIEGYPDRASSADDYSDIKPEILGRYLKAGETYVSQAKNVLSNSAKGTTNGESGYYSSVMRSMNVIGKLDIELMEMLDGFFTGTTTDMYDTLELKVVKGLLKFWDCLKDFVLTFQCDDCTLDNDSLKEASCQVLEDCMNDIMRDLHCLLLKKKITKVDDNHLVKNHDDKGKHDTFKFLKSRVQDKIDSSGTMIGMNGMIPASETGLQKTLLTIATKVLKLFNEGTTESFEVYEEFYKYDTDDTEEFVVDCAKFKTWVKTIINDISTGMDNKTLSYFKTNMDAVRTAIFNVTLGHMNFDLFKYEVNEAHEEFVTIDECDNNSQDSIHSRLTKALHDTLNYSPDVCVSDIHANGDCTSLKEMVEIKYKVKGIKWTITEDTCPEWTMTVGGRDKDDKSVTIDKIGSELNKRLSKTKQATLDVVSKYVDQIDELYDIPVTTTTTTTITPAVATSSGGNMNLVFIGVAAVGVVGGLVFLATRTSESPKV